MFVKKYHDYRTRKKSEMSKPDICRSVNLYESYFEDNPEYEKARKDFKQLMEQKICEAIFSYFPELKPKEKELRPKIVFIIQENWNEFFLTAFEIIYKYIDNPERDDEQKEWKYHIKSEEEIQKAAQESVEKFPIEFRDKFKKSRINSWKNWNHFNYFEIVMHKAVLYCVTAVFEEVPDLSGNGIRSLNYAMAADTALLKNEIYELFVDDLKAPYKDEIEK